jgi:hypothetical protein
MLNVLIFISISFGFVFTFSWFFLLSRTFEKVCSTCNASSKHNTEEKCNHGAPAVYSLEGLEYWLYASVMFILLAANNLKAIATATDTTIRIKNRFNGQSC